MASINEAQSVAIGDLLVYLFSEMFAEPAKGLLTQAMIAPQSGEKMNLKHVVVQAYLAAFMDLTAQGTIRLEPFEVRKLFAKETTVRAELGNLNVLSRSPFQATLVQIMGSIRNPAESRV